MGNRYTKPVAFNSNNPVDRMIEEYVKNKNFSGTCKRLLIAEMKENGIEVPRRKKTPRMNTQQNEQVNEPPKSAAERLAQLKNELNERFKNVNNESDSGTDSETYE